MTLKREQSCSALFGQLRAMALAATKRNEALAQAARLIILRDGEVRTYGADATLKACHARDTLWRCARRSHCPSLNG